jgi:hypothetical protein
MMKVISNVLVISASMSEPENFSEIYRFFSVPKTQSQAFRRTAPLPITQLHQTLS